MQSYSSAETMRAKRRRSPWWTLGLIPSHEVTLSGASRTAQVSFDLRDVHMSGDQRRAVRKLFDQDPIAVVAEEGHDEAQERGKEGPGSRYLSHSEFESIRELGVRLGTTAELRGIILNFCLHVLVLRPRPPLPLEVPPEHPPEPESPPTGP